jgi:hypothetical protein
MNQDLAVFLVPFALAIGGALLAAGGLYFGGIHYLANQRQAIAALVVGGVIMALLEIILYGSSVAFFKAQQVQTSACELEGESAHPEARQGKDSTVLHEAITACMQQAGYQWVGEHKHCKDATVATNPFCYLPIDSFDRTVTSVQMSFE